VEIVTEPDIHSPEHAREWLTLLRATLKALNVSDVDMSKGSLRVDANVSVRPTGSTELGTKTELKNMNSFRFLERGLRAELDRQFELVRSRDAVVQETLHFDPVTGQLSPLRSKEEAHDYRYFPEPDLMPLNVSDELLHAASGQVPELPAQRATRFERELRLSAVRARELAFRTELADYFERALEAANKVSAAELANWVPLLVERIGSDSDPASSRVAPERLAALAAMVKERKVSRDAARKVLTEMVASGDEPHAIAEREGLMALAGGDGQLAQLVERAIAQDPNAAEQVRANNMKAIGPLVGYVMRETRGRADGGQVRRLILERLGQG
jgi:aspartyl-tRNA(Asn)/glutamyl-tRNA(Gln) amidotransferase subunit B